jgi:uncharacterized protein (DUF1501 family)
MRRRQFLHYSSLLSVSMLTILAVQPQSTSLQFASAQVARAMPSSARPKRLIVIFLRGAVDGLNVVVPYADPIYYQVRPQIAIPKPEQAQGVLRLDDRFGLHPALAPLMPLWQQGSLAFIHGAGSPDETRSHFDAQAYMETGTPGVKRTREGWMNRLLASLANHTVIQAVNVGATTPRILSGPMATATLASGRNSARSLPLDDPTTRAAFDRLYSSNDQLSQTYHTGKTARQLLLKDLDREMMLANNGAPLPNGFAQDAQRLAQLMARDARVQLGFLALGGWDTHVNQGASQGQLARNLQALGRGLAALKRELGAVYADTAIVVLSEFGRTVRENGNGGTDHGHGNVMWLLGGAVKGGKVYGQFPGLQPEQLYQGRDLAITTDFRDVLMPVLIHQFGLNATQMTSVFPGYTAQRSLDII